MPLQLDYYYGNEAEQYSFYRIPKILFTDPLFKGVSVEAKVLYGLLLDRMGLSYIIFTIADVMETLGCAEQKANKLLNELDCAKGVGLIERVRRGLGKPNVIYVKNFICRAKPGRPESQIKNCENHKSGDVKNPIHEIRKPQTHTTDDTKTAFSDTDPSIYPAKAGAFPVDNVSPAGYGMDGIDQMEAYRELIKENIDYDYLLHDHPYDKERLDGFVELMAETCCSNRKSIRINQGDMSTEVVKSRFLKLDSGHIQYVMDCLDRNTTLVGNIRAYTLSALFNAPVTISQYYASLVSHDMAAGFGSG